MKEERIFANEWLAIHPYNSLNESDIYFTELSNKILKQLDLPDINTETKKKCAIYICAYLEDIISGLDLWSAFTNKCKELYSTPLPFYETDLSYTKNEVNIQDIMFILWNTLYKSKHIGTPATPLDKGIKMSAIAAYNILSEEYETAPENERLCNYFDSFEDKKEAKKKLEWLFGHTYLTAPSVEEYIHDLSETDRFIVPCGPLALFLYEWIELLCKKGTEDWKKIDGLFFTKPEIPEKMKEKNKEIYQNFIDGNNGNRIVYLEGYAELKSFLTQVLKWPDDESHTLPQMKEFKNFVLLCNKDKGMLLAHDICQYIADPMNPYYNKQDAEKGAFTLLSVPTKCPPDLLEYLIANGYIPDAQFPGLNDKGLTVRNADFIARCTLLYYYRGD